MDSNILNGNFLPKQLPEKGQRQLLPFDMLGSSSLHPHIQARLCYLLPARQVIRADLAGHGATGSINDSSSTRAGRDWRGPRLQAL